MITLINGRPGSGKTYYALRDLVLPALDAGRAVWHNIPGFAGGVLHKGSSLVVPDSVYNSETGDVDFTGGDDSMPPGALLVIDELTLLTRFWTKEEWRRFVIFATVHRHYVGEQAGRRVASDIAIISQNDSAIPAEFFKLIEETVIFVRPKLKKSAFLGYRFMGGQHFHLATKRLWLADDRVELKRDKRIFARYNSFAGGGEAGVTTFAGSWIWRLKAPLLIVSLALTFFVWNLSDFLAAFGWDDPEPAAVVQGALPALPAERDRCSMLFSGECVLWRREVW